MAEKGISLCVAKVSSCCSLPLSLSHTLCLRACLLAPLSPSPGCNAVGEKEKQCLSKKRERGTEREGQFLIAEFSLRIRDSSAAAKTYI